nr:hypothetical protein [Tanacetum cinerariifolium]
MGKTIGELHAMLIKYEKGLPKNAETPQVMMIKGGKIHKSKKKSLKAKGKGKANGKGNDKHAYIPKPKNPKPSAKEHPTKDDTCHHCKEVGHWKSNFSKNNVLYFNAIPSNGIYEIDMHDLDVNSIYIISTKRSKHNLDSTYLWHCRLAHISKKRIVKLQQEGILKSTDDESFDQCVSCLSGKMTRKSFPYRPERATDLLGIIDTDVCGPLRHVSRQGASYFITFTDDYSRYGYVYLLKHKHEVFETFKVFKNEVENQLEKIIKALRSDQGGEYISQEFKDYLKASGIVLQLTPPYTPQHNGVSERRNQSATRILNMVPTKKVDKTPYELWYGKVPNLSYLKETMGYYFYFPPKNKIGVARYVEFFEKKFITQEVSGRAVDLEEIQDEDTSPSEITSKIPMVVEGFEPPQEEVILIRRSERTHRAPNRLCLNVEVEEHSLGDLNEPASYKSAMLDSESNMWIDAMNAEIQSMIDNMVWVSTSIFLLAVRLLGAEFETDRDDTKSHIGYVFILNGGAMNYKSSKQSTTTMSATEAEYIAALEAATKAVWIRKFISGLSIVPTINEPIRMFYDNLAALYFANEPRVQRGARHYHRRYHYVRESIVLGEIRFLKVHTDENLADPFTKALPDTKLTQHVRSMGLRLASSFM